MSPMYMTLALQHPAANQQFHCAGGISFRNFVNVVRNELTYVCDGVDLIPKTDQYVNIFL